MFYPRIPNATSYRLYAFLKTRQGASKFNRRRRTRCVEESEKHDDENKASNNIARRSVAHCTRYLKRATRRVTLLSRIRVVHDAEGREKSADMFALSP
jgi:hypothetical protein